MIVASPRTSISPKPSGRNSMSLKLVGVHAHPWFPVLQGLRPTRPGLRTSVCTRTRGSRFYRGFARRDRDCGRRCARAPVVPGSIGASPDETGIANVGVQAALLHPDDGFGLEQLLQSPFELFVGAS